MLEERATLNFLFLILVLFAVSCAESTSNNSDFIQKNRKTKSSLSYDDSANGDCVAYTASCNGFNECVMEPVKVDSTFKVRNVKKMTYYIDSSIYSSEVPSLLQIEDFHEVFPNLVGQAAEVWNSESQAPPLIYGGQLSAADFKKKKATSEEPIILVRFQKGCAPSANSNGQNSSSCLANRGAETAPVDVDTEGNVTKYYLSLFTEVMYNYFLESKGKEKVEYVSDIMKAPWVTIADEGEEFEVEFRVADPKTNSPELRPDIPQQDRRRIHSVNMEGLLVHEFGHALGIWEHASADSVMVQAPDTRQSRHLWHWDKKCIRGIYGDRKVSYKARPIDFRGNLQSSVVEGLISQSSAGSFASEPTTNKGSRLGIGRTLKDNSEDFSVLYSMLLDPVMASLGIENNRMFHIIRACPENKNCKRVSVYKTVKPQNPVKYQSLNNGTKFTFDVNPTFSMVNDKDGYSDSFIYHYSGSKIVGDLTAQAIANDPPYLKVSYVDSSAKRVDRAVKGDFAFLDQSKHFWSDKLIYSHLPVSTAYDHSSKNYIQAVVHTIRPKVSSYDSLVHKDEGGIYFGTYDTGASTNPEVEWDMHDFFHDARQRLMEKIKEHPFWKPKFKTQFGVAVACTDHFTKYKYDRFNCFLAWIDRGLPRKDNVLYTWFRLVLNDSSGRFDIDWSNKVYVRSGFYAVGHLSAAFVGGALVLTGKSALEEEGEGSSIMLSRNPLNKATGFSTVIERLGKNVVDAPSVGAVRYRNGSSLTSPIEAHDGLLLWTEL